MWLFTFICLAIATGLGWLAHIVSVDHHWVGSLILSLCAAGFFSGAIVFFKAAMNGEELMP